MADTTGDVQVVKRQGTAALSDYSEAIRQADELVSGAIGILKAPIEAPELNFPGLDEVRARSDKATATSEATNTQIGVERDEYNKAAASEQAAITAKGQADADYARAKGQRSQMEAEVYKAAVDAMHVNVSDIAEVGKQLARERPIAEAKLRALQESQATNFLDSPIDYLVAKIKEPALANDYNRSADIVNNLEESISKGIEIANAGATLNAKSIPQITAAMSVSEAKSLEAGAAQNRAIAEEKLATQNVSFAQQKLANDITALNVTKEMTAVDIDKMKTEYTAAIKKIELSDTHATRMLRAAELLDKLEKNKGLDLILENYDRIMGNPKGTTNRYTFEKFADAQRTNIVAIGAGSGGTDPFQALVNLSQSGLRPGPAFSSSRLMSWSQNLAENIARSQDIQQLDEKQKPMAISNRMKQAIEQEKLNPTKIDSPFFEASPKEMILSGAIPKESPVAAMLAPYANQDQQVPTGVIIEAFNKNFKNPVEAGGALADYYRRNIILRNSTNNYKLLGITPDENYKMKVRGSMFGGGFIIDLTKPEEATKLILFNRAMESVKEGAHSFGKYG